MQTYKDIVLLPHQQDAIQAVLNDTGRRSSVQMATGTGKTYVMLSAIEQMNKNKVVIVFPILSLVDQFYNQYIQKYRLQNYFYVCSPSEAYQTDTSHTWYNSDKDISEIFQNDKWIIITTYQSLDRVLNSSSNIDLLVFDEAQCVEGEKCQETLQTYDHKIDKIIEFSATLPEDRTPCYSYTYSDAVKDGCLRDFDIHCFIDFIDNQKILKSRLIEIHQITGNGKIMAFTGLSEADRDGRENVVNFVNKYKSDFDWISGITASTRNRTDLLEEFGNLSEDTISILTSCKTIGVGVDVANVSATMFVDAIRSRIDIIQKIGRCVRLKKDSSGKRLSQELQTPSSIIVPIYIDRTKYERCQSKEEVDELLREAMSADGDFATIFNILCALKQSDPEMYNQCIKLASIDKIKVKEQLETQGYRIEEMPKDGDCFFHCINRITGREVEELRNDVVDWIEEHYEDYCEYLDEEANIEELRESGVWNREVMDIVPRAMSDMLGLTLRIHTGDAEPVVYGEDIENAEDLLLHDNHYDRIVSDGSAREKRERPECRDRKQRKKLNIRFNDELKILWKMKEEDLTNEFTCRLDFEIEDEGMSFEDRALKRAVEIVERCRERERLGKNLLPKQYRGKKDLTSEQLQEKKDAQKLGQWKLALKDKKYAKIFLSVKKYLDANLEGWNEERDLEKIAMQFAIGIVQRAKYRVSKELNIFPKQYPQYKKLTPEQQQETKDSEKLYRWKQSLIYPSVKQYLDVNLEGWNEDLEHSAMKFAVDIVGRANERINRGFHRLPRSYCGKKDLTLDQKQERKDSEKLHRWKQSLIYSSVKEYLDANLECWNEERDLEQIAMQFAIGIVQRANERVTKGLNKFPKRYEHINELSLEQQQERKDSQKLGDWKKALKGKGNQTKCYPSVKEYLDANLEGWNEDLEQIAMNFAVDIVGRANERINRGFHRLPKTYHGEILTLQQQEHKDAKKLQQWRQSLIYPSVKEYLDANLEGWNEERDLEQIAMQFAIGIVQRANERVSRGFYMLPKQYCGKIKPTLEQQQESKDAQKLYVWKQALKDTGTQILYSSVKEYLDANLEGWNENLEQMAMNFAVDIVGRANERINRGFHRLPKEYHGKTNLTLEQQQERKDARKLQQWKQAMKGNSKANYYSSIKKYLDENLECWNEEEGLEQKAMQYAIGIVQRANIRINQRLDRLPKSYQGEILTLEQQQESEDARKLQQWKQALKGNSKAKCYQSVKEYLDANLEGWNEERDLEQIAMQFAIGIVQRVKDRVSKGLHRLPKDYHCKILTPEQQQERKDAQKLGDWKKSLKGKGTNKCYPSVKQYLDNHLPGWYRPDSQSETRNDETQSTISSTSVSIQSSSKSKSSTKQSSTSKPATLTALKEEARKLKIPRFSTYTSKNREELERLIEEHYQKITSASHTKSILYTPPIPNSQSSTTASSSSNHNRTPFTNYHKKYHSTSSNELHQYFQSNREEWHNYHHDRDIAMSDYRDNQPPIRLADYFRQLRTSKTKTITDFGCGTCLFSNKLKSDTRFQITNIDHIAFDDNVLERDFKNTELGDCSQDYVVMCLSLSWGTDEDRVEYLEEVRRILDCQGELIVVEPHDRMTEDVIDMIERNGFQLKKKTSEEEKFVYCYFVKKDV